MKHLVIPILATVTTVLNPVTAQADLGDQIDKLLADDGAVNDSFGISVSISPDGIRAIVGSFRDDDNGTLSGSAYIFDTSTGQQTSKLLSTFVEAGDFFGYSVDINEDTAIVGAYLADIFGNNSNSGSAYLFDSMTGKQNFMLIPIDGAANDFFGQAVAINSESGKEIAILGARGDDDNGNESGSAYLFDTTTGHQLAKLLPDDGAAGDHFGSAVGISGNIAFVGASGDDDNGIASGSAYLFDISNPVNPIQIAKLLPDDGESFDNFGLSVAVSGNVAIVGATGDDDNADYSGSAYLFDITTGLQLSKLLPDDGAAGDQFGISVGISSNTAIVGTIFDDDNGEDSGSAYLFDITTNQQFAKLLPNDGAAEDVFGGSVVIRGSDGNEVAIVGAHRDDDNGEDSGSAYLFDASSSPEKCPWDLDDNSNVGTSDLLELFAQWGKPGPADFDESGAVGTSDLLILFANWGPCP